MSDKIPTAHEMRVRSNYGRNKVKIRTKIKDFAKIENKHLRRAAFCLTCSCWILEVSIAGVALAVTGVVILWVLTRLGLPGLLEHPEQGLLDQLAFLDFKSVGIFVSVLLGICLALAAIEYLEYRYQEIKKM